MRPFLIFLWEIFKIVMVAAAIIVPIRYFLFQPFFVNGASMEPNFEDGEYLIIDEISYRIHEPSRGEVIIFRFPGNRSQFYIKRIIGLPGETIEINGSQITVKNKANPQGFVLEESSYLKNVPNMGQEKITLGENNFFVMGDNRTASYDSRRWGPLSRQDIIGRAWLRAWPINRAQAIEVPVY